MKAYLEYIEGYKTNDSMLDANIGDLTDAIVNLVDLKSSLSLTKEENQRMDRILSQTSSTLCALRKIKAELEDKGGEK